MTLKEYIKMMVDYLEGKKISDFKFETRYLPLHSEAPREDSIQPSIFIAKFFKYTNGGFPTEVYIDRLTFEAAMDIREFDLEDLQDQIYLMVKEQLDGSIGIIKLKINQKEIPLEFIRSDETDPSIIALTTMRILGKQITAEPFTLQS